VKQLAIQGNEEEAKIEEIPVYAPGRVVILLSQTFILEVSENYCFAFPYSFMI
jgi:hypothetical protein